MHDSVLAHLKKYIDLRRPYIENVRVADLGGRNVNGCVKDLLRNTIAFDISQGIGIDVVIPDGGPIPDEHKNIYPFVFATSTINFCKSIENFICELEGLLSPNGEFFINGCTHKCPYGHDSELYKLYNKFSVEEYIDIFKKFDNVQVIDLGADAIITGCKKIEHSRTSILNYLINQNDYRSYLEIGIRYPHENFDKIVCKDKTGVDPAVSAHSVVTMMSDKFFELNRKKFDLIFIDGDHRYDQVMRDIGNALLILNDNGTIVLHDCYPKQESHQGDEKIEDTWMGSVWRAFVHLRSTRSDLTMYTCEADCGCGIIRKGNQNVLTIQDIDWKYFSENYKSLLNLSTFDEFIAKEKRR